ncbi:MAG: hypothetical protein IE881_01960 [Epsilonproteobacteria bacterium]|nr:hypothetical protein [Campylobacterota bacterium]
MIGYRGALIIEEGKQNSPDRKLPPKIQAKQVILIADDTKIKFFSSELESILDFKPFFEKYKAFFTPESLVILYVTDLNKNGSFVYEGVNINAYVLDESSVWMSFEQILNLKGESSKKIMGAV